MKLWDSNPKWPWPYDEDISKYLDVPDYYLVGYEEVRGFLRAIDGGHVDSAGKSAGGRDLTVIRYGPKRPARKLLVAAGTHGTETEGIAAVINVIKALETGRDLRGRKWPALGRIAESVGIYLMPFYNPDAAARMVVKSYVGMPLAAVNMLHVGFWKNRRMLNYKRVFGKWTPASDLTDRLDRLAYLGSRHNDAGCDINRPASGRKATAVETMQMLDYLQANRIDCYVDLHSHSSAPWLGMAPPEHTIGNHADMTRLQELTRRQTRKAGGPDLVLAQQGDDSWYNNHFFPANLGIYAFTYEEKAGFTGNFPADKPFEEIWLENTYNGMYAILGLAQALLHVPSPWK